MKIYISGKITGTTDYMQRFESAEKALSNYTVINPAKVNAQLPKETVWEEYMKMSMCMLEMCNAIYMLKGWEVAKVQDLNMSLQSRRIIKYFLKSD